MATTIPSNRAPFTLQDILTATGGVPAEATSADRACDETLTLRGVSTDTRSVSPGAAFVALRGERFDGHRFVTQAAQAGAGLAIVEERQDCPLPQIIVPNTLVALGELAAFHRQRWGGAVIAIAGAAGKTTTRAFTSALLSEGCGSAVHSTVGNLNNRIGVPMVLLGLEPSHRLAVVEVGTNQPGEVRALANIVRPDVAVLTLVALEHSEGLGDLDDIEREEGEIFADSCRALIVNGDDERAVRQARAAQARSGGRALLRSYGFAGHADLRALERTTVNSRQSRLRISRAPAAIEPTGGVSPRSELELSLPMVGQPAVYALLAGWLAAEALLEGELSVGQLQRALSSPQLQPQGRAEMVELASGALVVNDSYNANPPSVSAALQTATELSALRGGQLHLVLGEMRELGPLSVSAHAELGRQLQQLPWATLCLIGDEMRAALDAVQPLADPKRVVSHTKDTTGVAALVRSRLGPQDVVLVKGSRGIRTEQVIADLMSKKAARP